MNYLSRFILVLVLGVMASPLMARSDGSMMRGGIGFLFPDYSSFRNPSSFGTAKRGAVQGMYLDDQPSTLKAMSFSAVAGDGKKGGGVAATRAGTGFVWPDIYVDTATAGAGTVLNKDFTFGATYIRDVSNLQTPTIELMSVALTYNYAKPGLSMGLSYTTNPAFTSHSGIAAIGIRLSQGVGIEANMDFADLNNFNNFTAAAYLTISKRFFYLSAGSTYVRSSGSNAVLGRAGLVLGPIDVSAFGSYTLETSTAHNLGGSARLAF